MLPNLCKGELLPCRKMTVSVVQASKDKRSASHIPDRKDDTKKRIGTVVKTRGKKVHAPINKADYPHEEEHLQRE